MTRLRRPNEGRAMDPQSGMVLIELVGVIAVAAMLLAVVITLFAGVYGVERSWRDAAADGRELQRLAAYFRADAHSAADIRVADDGESWSFTRASGGRIDYEILADGVRRISPTASGDETGMIRQQELSLPTAAAVGLEEMLIGGRRMVTLTITADSADGTGRAPVLRVDAELGRLDRMSSSAGGRRE